MVQNGYTLLFLILDAIFINFAYFSALLLRYDNNIPFTDLHSWLILAPGITLLTIVAYIFFGLYRRLWRYASIGDLYAVLGGVTVGSLFVVALAYIFIYPSGLASTLPRSVYFIAWLLNLVFTGGSRLSLRSMRNLRGSSDKIVHKKYSKDGAAGYRHVLIVGAGDAGAVIVRELRNHPALGLEPVGFIDDDPRKKGLYLLGVPVLGTREDIQRIVTASDIDEIIIALPSVSGAVMREIVEICKITGAKLKTLPGVYELIDGKVSVTQIRDVQLEDLLGREPVQLNLDEIAAYITGKAVLVTGAGGSIGSELCRHIARFHPTALILLDNTENNLFDIEQELHDLFPDLNALAELADIRDKQRIENIFDKYRPQVIFHAAAYKHVPMMERHPDHAVSNNIWGTYQVAAAAQRYGTGVFILVSTDKAVSPSSTMGATKRAAELVIQHLSEEGKSRNLPTRFAAVRFGNVLGSRGSVIPTFKRQIAQGGPITVTHPDMERYFMTIPEAVQLIIQAGALAQGGEIFVLDMGEPMKIVDIARDLIRLSGLVPDEDIEIKFTGIRPGEKLQEVLFTMQEKMTATKNSRIFVAYKKDDENLNKTADLIDKLHIGFGLKNAEEALGLLSWLLPIWDNNRHNNSQHFMSTDKICNIN